MPRYPQNNLAACMLPWTEDFELDVPVFERHIQSTLDDGYKCLYLMGTAGEGYALNAARFGRVVEVFAGLAVRDGIDPQIGVIGTSMEQSLERIQFAYDLGIRMFQISLPSWGTLDEGETLLFFQTVSPGASHVGVAIGGRQFVHAPSSRGVVRVERYDSTHWASRFVGARRVPDATLAAESTLPGSVQSLR